MPDPYMAGAWYWITDNTADKVFSSAAAAWLDTGDAGYVAWLGRGNQSSSALCDGELADG